ncbi:hypothetical protein B9Z55_015732 [Caenorhabditis nigoni]|uniref:Homeobox domain-containing protein n=1 Tax=Caenorhabditis nigoni TaxID=1611254 RepID=A0A2G5UBH4_9PELO|nr:hypothetical protein B9Z55_015732 [Caenorhabditis nigoni]
MSGPLRNLSSFSLSAQQSNELEKEYRFRFRRHVRETIRLSQELGMEQAEVFDWFLARQNSPKPQKCSILGQNSEKQRENLKIVSQGLNQLPSIFMRCVPPKIGEKSMESIDFLEAELVNLTQKLEKSEEIQKRQRLRIDELEAELGRVGHAHFLENEISENNKRLEELEEFLKLCHSKSSALQQKGAEPRKKWAEPKRSKHQLFDSQSQEEMDGSKGAEPNQKCAEPIRSKPKHKLFESQDGSKGAEPDTVVMINQIETYDAQVDTVVLETDTVDYCSSSESSEWDDLEDTVVVSEEDLEGLL